MSAHPAASLPTRRPLAEPLRLAAVDVAQLARMSALVEETVARVAACAPIADPDLLAQCQLADLMTQRLAGLAAFLEALAEDVPPDARVDVERAVLGLTLAEQAGRLSAQTPDGWDAGDLVLF